MPPAEPTATDATDPLCLDLRTRWTPSSDQDRQAAETLRENLTRDWRRAIGVRNTTGATIALQPGAVFTIQLLIGKQPIGWSADVQVWAMPGVFTTRAEAYAACKAAIATHLLLRPGVPVQASYARHHTFATSQTPALTCDNRRWETHWAIFEY